jgi:hypothetical protein
MERLRRRSADTRLREWPLSDNAEYSAKALFLIPQWKEVQPPRKGVSLLVHELRGGRKRSPLKDFGRRTKAGGQGRHAGDF